MLACAALIHTSVNLPTLAAKAPVQTAPPGRASLTMEWAIPAEVVEEQLRSAVVRDAQWPWQRELSW